MNTESLELMLAIQKRIAELLSEATNYPAVADGHTLLAGEAGLGKGPITKEQLYEIRDGALLIGKAAGAAWIADEIGKTMEKWEKDNP